MTSTARLKTPSKAQRIASKRRAIQAEKARRAIDSFAAFARQAWPILEPGTPLVWTWYLQVLCDALEKQMRGDPEFRKLLICIPPGTAKSTIVNVLAPAWQWLHEPTRRKLCLSNDDRLAERDSRKSRNVINSEWYRSLVATVAKRNRGTKARDPKARVGYTRPWTLAKDQSEKVNFENTRTGFRQSYSINAKVTGKRTHDITIDDPVDAKEVVIGSTEQVAKRMLEINDVIEKTLPSRADMRTARWTLIMQRLHDDDPAAHALADRGWHVIQIQMEFDPTEENNHPDDPRTKEGELLNEEIFPPKEVAKVKDRMGDDWWAQYQQRPRPRGGGMLKRWYWSFWYPKNVDPPPPIMVKKPDGTVHECTQAELPANTTGHSQSWDMAFKDTKHSAYVVGQVWATLAADAYLLDQMRDRMDINATIDAVRALSARWPQAFNKLVEDKANGPAVIGMLQRELPGLNSFSPKGGKEERANAIAPLCRSGNVWLPHPTFFPWVQGLLDETASFPNSAFKDQVDALTQFLLHWQGGSFWFV